MPIHYGEFDAPPVYVETPDLARRLAAAADAYGVVVATVQPGTRVQ